ncbi:hypothetical protein ES319_D09G037300v1 [Gossypium barbadense]|uniref:Uncharacterized protein n=2 Tax=Gossypium TaxID=3633 RepID=A0A5J5Q0Q8_GOSBA|nr:hypothetical protein ES319_D09G037300v1 [Gossypium barbadense]PPE01283.1 hypothetical protein GOBAR_DD01672 [Gossypium barbadense]TYG52622.1 hypothetical protein ES288_D09G042900v1 [Gossypium darwinii]
MGCSVSKCEEGRGSSACYQFRIVHRKNGCRAVVDNILLLSSNSKPLPEGGDGETHAKERNKNVKKMNSEGKKGPEKEKEGFDKGKDDGDGHDSFELPRSPSFKIFCSASLREKKLICAFLKL